ncbi:hypothetical protein HBI56_213260 [Parastagonospora nodorum]|nr:hypothetical protein HBH52_234100 [Parastagonospora nodorum]KAH3991812.1 hypothetical protein HBI10_226290 [Parastagonospora nodorum]KAH4009358.1 hypothetical protein HBI13_221000 [Parastagonospora nodorum]KAH4013871.1 hypothetical protein HBI09_212110 [Parastagonospora nodorum]KAH4043280.1 hypothetical protein HBH49_235280 [Parastagonospora nodorum]
MRDHVSGLCKQRVFGWMSNKTRKDGTPHMKTCLDLYRAFHVTPTELGHYEDIQVGSLPWRTGGVGMIPEQSVRCANAVIYLRSGPNLEHYQRPDSCHAVGEDELAMTISMQFSHKAAAISLELPVRAKRRAFVHRCWQHDLQPHTNNGSRRTSRGGSSITEYGLE